MGATTSNCMYVNHPGSWTLVLAPAAHMGKHFTCCHTPPVSVVPKSKKQRSLKSLVPLIWPNVSDHGPLPSPCKRIVPLSISSKPHSKGRSIIMDIHGLTLGCWEALCVGGHQKRDFWFILEGGVGLETAAMFTSLTPFYFWFPSGIKVPQDILSPWHSRDIHVKQQGALLVS